MYHAWLVWSESLYLGSSYCFHLRLPPPEGRMIRVVEARGESPWPVSPQREGRQAQWRLPRVVKGFHLRRNPLFIRWAFRFDGMDASREF